MSFFQVFLWLSQIYESVVLMLLHVFLHLYLVPLALSLLRWWGFLLCARLFPLVSLVGPSRVLGIVYIVLPCGFLLWMVFGSSCWGNDPMRGPHTIRLLLLVQKNPLFLVGWILLLLSLAVRKGLYWNHVGLPTGIPVPLYWVDVRLCIPKDHNKLVSTGVLGQ